MRYLVAGYASMMEVQINFQETVLSISHNSSGEWEVITQPAYGEKITYKPKIVIIATGENVTPVIPSFPDQDKFRGTIVHSSKYTTAEDFSGKKVLVVGFGNTGGEVAIDLWEHGCTVSAIARSPINVMDRHNIALAAAIVRYLPVNLQISAERFLTKLLYGDLTRYGLACPIPGRENAAHYRLRDHHEAPIVDIGQIDLIRKSEIKIIPHEISNFTQSGVVLKNGKEETFDAVVLATGFKPSFPSFLSSEITKAVISDKGFPKASGEEIAGVRGLYFIGFADESGRILRITEDAIRIANSLKKSLV